MTSRWMKVYKHPCHMICSHWVMGSDLVTRSPPVNEMCPVVIKVHAAVRSCHPKPGGCFQTACLESLDCAASWAVPGRYPVWWSKPTGAKTVLKIKPFGERSSMPGSNPRCSLIYPYGHSLRETLPKTPQPFLYQPIPSLKMFWKLI